MSQPQIPEQMTAVVLDSYTGHEALRVEERPVPNPGKDEVLVKVAASPINPSDIAELNGRYGFKNPPPIIPGGEGSGTVVAVGPGFMGRYLLGKRVACLSRGEGDGLWADYVVVSAKGGALPLHDSVSLEQGSMSTINPLTAIGHLELAKEGGHKAVLITAAASSLGQMINRLFHSEGIQVINVVRREAQLDLLKRQGVTIALNCSDADFDQQLHDICHQHDIRLALDAVAGPMTTRLLKAMPNGSQITIYGVLSRQGVQVDPSIFIFEDKTINGFWLGPWIMKKHILQIQRLWRRAQKLMASELKSKIRAEYPFEQTRQAIDEYLNQMTGGKILLRPNH